MSKYINANEQMGKLNEYQYHHIIEQDLGISITKSVKKFSYYDFHTSTDENILVEIKARRYASTDEKVKFSHWLSRNKVKCLIQACCDGKRVILYNCFKDGVFKYEFSPNSMEHFFKGTPPKIHKSKYELDNEGYLISFYYYKMRNCIVKNYNLLPKYTVRVSNTGSIQTKLCDKYDIQGNVIMKSN